LCFLSSSNGRADASTSVTTVDSSSDEQMMLVRPLLLGATVATGVFGSSLLSYLHSSDALVATYRLSVTTVTYDPLLQFIIIVVLLAYLMDLIEICKPKRKSWLGPSIEPNSLRLNPIQNGSPVAIISPKIHEYLGITFDP
jgi:hypothetical protein